MIYYILADDFGGLEYGIEEEKERVPAGADTFDSEEKFNSSIKSAELAADKLLFKFIADSENDVATVFSNEVTRDILEGLGHGEVIDKHGDDAIKKTAIELGIDISQYKNSNQICRAIEAKLLEK